VYQEEFERKAEAIDREIEIKKRKSRRYIEKLVQSVPVFP
jgi:predicted GIY-YIG superfamily endonuclease